MLNAGNYMALGDTHLRQRVDILVAWAWDLIQRILLQPEIPVLEVVENFFQGLMRLLSHFKNRQVEGD